RARRGNRPPAGVFDGAQGGGLEPAGKVPGTILNLCIEHGGSITGEHGVGAEKPPFMPSMFTADDLDSMQLVRCAFDPGRRANPGKVFPNPRLCGEPRGGKAAGAIANAVAAAKAAGATVDDEPGVWGGRPKPPTTAPR